jgi:hypothetical protein
VKKTYQGTADKSKGKFEVLGKGALLVEVPLPMVEVWEELQAQVEQLTGEAGLRIIGTILENEVTRRVGPPHRPGAESGAVRWGRQPGYVVFGGRKVAVERPRVRTREGREVELDSYARLQHDGRRQRAVREGIVAGLTSRSYQREPGIRPGQCGAVERTVREETQRSGLGGHPDRWDSFWQAHRPHCQREAGLQGCAEALSINPIESPNTHQYESHDLMPIQVFKGI